MVDRPAKFAGFPGRAVADGPVVRRRADEHVDRYTSATALMGTMAENHTVELSDDEMAALEEAKEELYGDRDVPYSEVIQMLCSPYTD